MLASWFDVEVHTKTVREEIHREVEQNRLIAAAEAGRESWRDGASSVLARVMAALQAIVAARRLDRADTAAVPIANPWEVLPSLDSAPPASPSRPSRSAAPYAGMAIIARGKPLKPLLEPSSVVEC
jgi:hypothetical protein